MSNVNCHLKPSSIPKIRLGKLRCGFVFIYMMKYRYIRSDRNLKARSPAIELRSPGITGDGMGRKVYGSQRLLTYIEFWCSNIKERQGGQGRGGGG